MSVVPFPGRPAPVDRTAPASAPPVPPQLSAPIPRAGTTAALDVLELFHRLTLGEPMPQGASDARSRHVRIAAAAMLIVAEHDMGLRHG